MKRRHSGYTLIELLMVVMIIGILVALMFPVIGSVWRTVLEVQCQSNLKQLASVILAYCEANQGRFPVVGLSSTNLNLPLSAGDWLLLGGNNQGLAGATDWAGQSEAYKQDWFKRGVLNQSKSLGNTDIFFCPLDQSLGLPRPDGAMVMGSPAAAVTSYVMNGAITYGDLLIHNGIYTEIHVRRLQEFSPQTFMLIEEDETSPFNRPFMVPDSSYQYRLTARHRSGGYVACMDGHVDWMLQGNGPNDIDGPTNFKTETTDALRGSPWYQTTGKTTGKNVANRWSGR